MINIRIAVFFPIFGQSGYEVLCRGIVLALDRLGVNIKIVSKNEWNQEVVELSKDDTSRLERMCSNPISPEECDIHLLQQYVPTSYINSLDCTKSKAK